MHEYSALLAPDALCLAGDACAVQPFVLPHVTTIYVLW